MIKMRVNKIWLLGLLLLIGTAGFKGEWIKKVLALTETTKTVPTDVAFNASGYSGTNVSVGASEVTLAKSNDWWDLNWKYKKQLTIKNLGSSAVNTSVSLTTDLTALGLGTTKIRTDLADLRVVYSVGATPVHTEVSRTISADIGNTALVTITFPLQTSIGITATDTNYYLYYGNQSASSLNTNGHSIGSATATLVCPFNGTTTCVNSVGATVNPSTSTGAIRYSGSKGAMSFDGVNDQVDFPDITIGTTYTIETWVKTTTVNWAFHRLISTATGGVEVVINPNTSFGLAVFDTDGTIRSTTASFNDGSWHHIVVVREAGTYYFFVDGVGKSYTNSVPGNGYASGSQAQFGTSERGGLLDELRISDVARYTSNFTPPTTPFTPDANTKLLLHFDENGDDPRNTGKAIDSSGNGNHGTITGAKYVSGLVGVDASTSDTGNVNQQSYASHQGVFVEEGTTNLITNPSFEHSTYSIGWTTPYFNYSSVGATLSPNMSKRNSAGPFASGVMCQGKYDGTGVGDKVSWSPGSNVAGSFNQNFDGNQGSIVFWITPEWNGNDGKRHDLLWSAAGAIPPYVYKTANSYLTFEAGGGTANTDVSSWLAGTTYLVTIRWDSKNKLDGTNYVSISVGDTHTFGGTSAPNNQTLTHNIELGTNSINTSYPTNAIIEGLTVYRRPLFDGTYGIDAGNGDEIASIYNSGSGRDPTLVTGSWDVVFALPTNASTGSLGVGGTGQAWSHPHSSNLLGGTNGKNGFMLDGTYTNDAFSTFTPAFYTPYSAGTTAFAPNMAKRNSAGPFAAGVMSQGVAGSTPDVISIPSGSLLGGVNTGSAFYQNFDQSQGSIVLWITPEWNGNDNLKHVLYSWQINQDILYKSSNNRLYWSQGWDDDVYVDVSDWVAGRTYSVVIRWDRKNYLSGSNFASITVNNVTTFGQTTMSGTPAVHSPGYIGSMESSNIYPANALIEGLTVYRRPLYEATTPSGIDTGNGDEIASIYNSGSGRDPTLVTGSWDVVFALPTNASTGSLGVGGTGQAWSHPHASNLLYTSTTNTGGFMMNGIGSSDGWFDVGSPTIGTTLAASEKIFSGGYKYTSDSANEGIGRTFVATSGGDYVLRALGHSDGMCSPKIQVTRADGTTVVNSLVGTTASTRTDPDVYIFTWESPAAESEQVQLINTASSGTCYWHQVEVLSNGFNDPGFETASNVLVDAGTWESYLGDAHTGGGSLRGSRTGAGNTSAYRTPSATLNRFYSAGMFLKKTGSGIPTFYFLNKYHQQDGSASDQMSSSSSSWTHINEVVQYDGTGESWDGRLYYILSYSSDSQGLFDDNYYISLSDVSLTVTPASSANSTETSGLRVDGADSHTETISSLQTGEGVLRWVFTPRHSFGIGSSFGVVNPVIMHAVADNGNQIRLHKQNGTTLQLITIANGTTMAIGWTSPTLDAGTSYPMEIGYSGNSSLYLKVNNITVGSTNAMGVFTTAPTTVYWGTDNGGGGSNPYDGTYLTPNTPVTTSALATSEKIYGGGYKTTTDLVNTGIGITVTTTGGADYVIRGVVNSDGACLPRLTLYDDTGGTEIGHLDGTTTSTRAAPNVLLFTGEMTGSGTKTLKVKLTNSASSGTCYWHQVEVLSNLINNPSMETGSGDPWIPTGWGNQLVDAGESSQNTSDYHSGANSITLNVSVSDEIILIQPTSSANNYYSIGGWGKESSGDGVIREWLGAAHLTNQATGGQYSVSLNSTSWKHYGSVGFSKTATKTFFLQGRDGVSSFDDIYWFILSPLTLTATTASGANSSETTGLRVDGSDTLTQTVDSSQLTASSGGAKWILTPRHSFGVGSSFGFSSPTIISLYGDSSNYLKVSKVGNSLATTIAMVGTTSSAFWTTPVLNAGTTYPMEISYQRGGNLILKVGGTQVASSSIGIGLSFATIPTTAYFGSDNSGSNQYDATITNFAALAPTETTTLPYYKFGSKSVRLVNSGGVADEFAINSIGTSASTYTLSAYVYDGTSGNVGGTLSTSIAQLSVGQTGITTTYTDTGGGWWRLNGTTVGIGQTQTFGIQVRPGKTIYVDGVQMEGKSYVTTYADGTLGVGYSWGGTEHGSVSGRTFGDMRYANSVVNATQGTISFWVKPDYSVRNRASLFDWMNFNTGQSIIRSTWNGSNFETSCAGGSPKVTTAYNANTWYFVAVTWSGGNCTATYVNSSSAATTGAISAPNREIFLGSNGGGTPADSIFSNLRIYNSALSASEVSSLYWQGLQTHSSGGESVDRYWSSGSYVSSVIDLGMIGGWGATAAFVGTTASQVGTSAAFFTRTSADNSVWSDWVATVGTSINSDPRRYYQWRADISSSDDRSQTPTVSGMTVTYVEDVTAPENPTTTALGYSSGVGTTALTSGTWYNYTSPTFAWGTGVDTAANGQSSSGIKQYHVLLSSDIGSTPTANTSSSCYGVKTAAEERTLSCSLTTSGTYYLRLQTEDNSGNISTPVTLFTYKYDRNDPSAPASVSSTTVGYSATNQYSFYWPVATDTGGAGLRGYEYKTGATTGTFSQWQFATETTVTGVEAYQEGQNFFYVRSVDNAGNYSATTSNLGIAPFYYNESAPTAPRNVTIVPSTTSTTAAATNSFTVTWDKPETYSGEIAKYYYCVNCTPGEGVMSETTAAETVERTLTNVALATQQGKNTFYLVAEDNNINTETGKGNRNFEAAAAADFYASTTAPTAPTNLVINDASDRGNSKWRLTLVWEVGSTAVTPDHYEIYRSIDNTTFTSIGTVTATAYTDANLTQSRTYYYKIKAVDNAGSKSLYSSTVSLAPEGKYTSPPSAGGVPSAASGSTTATISWSTSRNAYGSVEYGETASYGATAGGSTSTSAHSIKLTGLAPGKTYHYRVLSLDDSSLVGYERSNAYSADYSFTTLSTAEISEVVVDEVGLDSATISWKTRTMATTEVNYGLTTEYGISKTIDTTSGSNSHTVRLGSLEHSTTYHFRIQGKTVDGDVIVSADQTFSTITYPKITAYVLKTDQGAGGTVIALAWSSNVPVSGVVEYQAAELIESTNPESTNLEKMTQAELVKLPIVTRGEKQYLSNANLSTTHSQRITSLEDGSIYVITLRGRDKYGNEAVSDPIRYVTGADTRPPKIVNLTVESQVSGGGNNNTSIIATWETDEPATTQVDYGQGSSNEYGSSTPKEEGLTKRHVVIVRDLPSNTSFHLRVRSEDESGNPSVSQDMIAVTPGVEESALDVVLNNLEDVFGFLKI